MALEFDREKYQKMVNYIRGAVGSVLSVYPLNGPKLRKNFRGEYVQAIQATENPEQFIEFVYRYCNGYKNYPDLPVLEFSEDFKFVSIKESYDSVIESFKPKKTTKKNYKNAKQG